MEKVVETKSCRHCGVKFDITNKDLEFYEKVSPIFNLETGLGKERPVSDNEPIKDLWNWKVKYLIPTPTLCPDCRAQRRLSWRNEIKLYKRNCDATWKQIVSIYSPDKPYKVYEQDFWWSDKWDSISYAKDFDFNRLFFDQFWDLLLEVPMQNIIWANNINSWYCNLAADNKNCYLISESSNNEDSYYWYWLQKSKDCVDTWFMLLCENCYESESCFSCINCFYIFNCNDCTYSYYLEDCIWCANCFWCVNLVDKSYCIFNKQYNKDEYEKTIKDLLKKEGIKKEFLDFKSKFPKKYSRITNSENCSWDQIENSKNCFKCFHAVEAEDCRYWEHVWRWAKDCMDVSTAWREVEKIYESINCWISDYNICFSVQCWSGSANLLYCAYCQWTKDCFWCVWLINKQYCILNKQYTKEEYNRLVPKIIEHMQKTWEWWEFFPSSLSPFWYNETVVEEYFPMTREEVINNTVISSEWNEPRDLKKEISPLQSKWQTFLHWPIFNRSDYEGPKPKVDKVIWADMLPNDINDIPDDILNWAIECEITKKPFRIIKEELAFYRKYNLPIPRRHPDQRYLDRSKLRNWQKIFSRVCDKCWIDIKTIYSPERPEVVYCEECYNKEVYWES